MFIDQAIKLAKKAEVIDEVPVGAVIVENNEVIATGYNGNMSDNITNHAEIIAINKAIKEKGDWRLNTCDMYITMEPCPMCAGAILKSRIKRIFLGTKSNINHNSELIKDILESSVGYHKTEIVYLDNLECSKILTDFFKKKRK